LALILQIPLININAITLANLVLLNMTDILVQAVVALLI
jgi:hypothetical protein